MRYLIIAVLVLSLGANAYFFLGQTKETVYINEMKTGEVQKSVLTTDMNGNKHTTFTLTEGNKVSRSDLREDGSKSLFLDSVANVLKVAKTQIEYYKRIYSTTSDSLLVARKQLNSSGKPIYTYNDKYVALKYTPSVDTISAGTFDFSYNADLQITQYTKRNKFLGLPIGAKKSYIDISSSDQRTKINGLKTLQIEKQEPFFGLRGQLSVNYNPQTGTYGFGPAVRLDLGRLSLQGNYMHYPGTGNWRPSINANFDLIRF